MRLISIHNFISLLSSLVRKPSESNWVTVDDEQSDNKKRTFYLNVCHHLVSSEEGCDTDASICEKTLDTTTVSYIWCDMIVLLLLLLLLLLSRVASRASRVVSHVMSQAVSRVVSRVVSCRVVTCLYDVFCFPDMVMFCYCRAVPCCIIFRPVYMMSSVFLIWWYFLMKLYLIYTCFDRRWMWWVMPAWVSLWPDRW